MARITSLLIGIMLVASSGATSQRHRATLEPLRWLAGTWRGTANGQNPFFEGYEFIDDSLVRIWYYTDSTATVVADSASVYVRGDTIYHEIGGEIWRAAKLDSVSVRFEPHEHVTTSFSWVRVGPDAWVATIEAPRGPPTVYRLERWRPGG